MNDPLHSSPPHPDRADTSPDATSTSAELTTPLAERSLGTIGPYHLLTTLGEGGMGEVWLAEQTEPVKRRVAIKIIKSGTFSSRALQRFDLERQTLAIMNHPAIAKVFDAGSTSTGQPYFVMEYVSGMPITNYCNQKHLAPRERIALMIKVCEGVQHAHQKAIMHRDLKPSNILITEIDGKPVPRIIDFGIAKATQDAGLDETVDAFTQAGGTVGTLGYMSPEQADPSVRDVDTRTDVYSLGVVLYELLTASLPFDTKQLRSKPVHEVLRQLHEEAPQRPSTRVSTDANNAAEKSGIDHQKLVSQLRGDLDWIALKALEPDRERRYKSPADLAADLDRYLRDDTVSARPPTLSYRARKFVRRNRLAVAFAAVVAVLIVVFAVWMTVERNRARREAETSRRVSDFMAHIFQVSDPSNSRGNTITARELLDKASTQIEQDLNQDPQVRGRLMQSMGTTYVGLGEYQQAEAILRKALDTETRTIGSDNPETLRTMAALGNSLKAQGHYPESETLLRQSLAGAQRVLGPEDPTTMNIVSQLTDTLSEAGKLSEAETLLRRTIANQQRTVGPENGTTLRSMRSLIANLASQSRQADAEKLARETLAIEKHALGPDHPGTLWTENNLALILYDEGHYAEAEKIEREAIDVSTRVLGPKHDNTLVLVSNLALSLQGQGRFAEAEAIQRENLETTRAAFGPDNPATVDSLQNLAITYGMQRKLPESEKLFRQALEILQRTQGPTAHPTRRAMGNLATTLAYEKRADEAIALFDRLIQASQHVEDTGLMDANYMYAAGLAILGRNDDAFAHLQTAVSLGFNKANQLATDDDLKPLRTDPRFQALLDQIKKK